MHSIRTGIHCLEWYQLTQTLAAAHTLCVLDKLHHAAYAVQYFQGCGYGCMPGRIADSKLQAAV